MGFLGDMLRNLPTLNELKGGFGERLAKFYGDTFTNAYVLHDVLIDGAEGMTSQIDLVMIGVKGIYVVEVKNYAEDARIYGDGKKKNWYYYLGGKKYTIYSPLMQNEQHIRYLKKQLDLPEEIPFFSVVLMLCDDFKVTNVNEDGALRTKVVCNSLPAMDRGIYAIADVHEEVLTEEQGRAIYEKIRALQYDGKAARIGHKEKVKSLKEEMDAVDAENLCPYCKKPLVLRKGKYGEFYGCPNYPKCRFTKKIGK